MQKEDKLKEISRIAAENASKAVTKLTNVLVRVEILTAGVKDIGEIKPILGAEEVVAGIYLPVTGEVQGAALLVFPKETALSLSDFLLRRPQGTTRKLSELDESALKEVGNIVSGSYFTVMSNKLQVKIIQHIPSFSQDMFGAIISQVLSKFAQKAEKALSIEVKFDFAMTILSGYFLLFFEVEEINAILGALQSK